MILDTQVLLSVAAVGVGATLVADLWALLLRRGFGVPSLSFCMVGRWLLHMPGGTFKHEKISAAAPRRFECAAGWILHYAVGIVFSFAFVFVVGQAWLARPTLVPAGIFGVVTVVFPYFILQPALGMGAAASKAPKPAHARLKSLVTHLVFGIGLYVSALAIGYASGALA